MALTPAMEDYLEAILMIKQQHGYVRCVDVAEQLGVKKPSVSRAVKELIKSGHLVKNADGTLSLTELGLQIAEQIYEKHLFFTKQLILAGVDPETAEQDACGIEHAVSSESFQKLKKAFDEADYEDIISDKEVGIVSIVGAGMMSNSGAASKMFEALYNRGINIHLIYTSEIKITVLIKESRVERAVEALKEQFQE